jgi:demethylmenaquinone methyltransferase/2-methoxy-6-polyprenyl-1,4-benzoquinol methylase
VRSLYLLYFRQVLPRIGRLVSKHTSAYTYLPDSVHAFPEPAAMVERIRENGFVDVDHRALTWGVASLYTAARP